MAEGAWWHKIVPTVAKAVRDVTPKVLSAATEMFGDFYNANVRNITSEYEEYYIELSELDLIEDFSLSAKLCEDIYNNIAQFEQLVLSNGQDEKPDCITYFQMYDDIRNNNTTTGGHTSCENNMSHKCIRLPSDDDNEEAIRQSILNEGTLWVVIRGTETLDDLVSDISWIANIQSMEDELLPGDQFEFPTKVVIKAKIILQNLIQYLEQNEQQKYNPYQYKEITRICFTGHSLGGAIATACHVMYNAIKDKNLMSIETGYDYNMIDYYFPISYTYSIGAPLLFHATELAMLTCSARRYSHYVHNIVFQLDPVPRLLGNHSLPNYIFLSKLEEFIRKFQFLVDRINYRIYGHYYLILQESKYENLEPKILRIPNTRCISKVLATFPAGLRDFIYGAMNDHHISNTVTTIKKFLLLKNDETS